jgi:hypothetical protein
MFCKGDDMKTPIAETLNGLTLGEPQVFQNLAVFPLLAGAETKADYLTLAEALKGGKARVTEVSAGGAVPELLLDNPSPDRVLLLDGDELVGAKQNRVLNITLLVGAHRKVVIPVSCVERGRWHARSADFRSEDRMMFAKGRAAKMAQVSRSIRETGTRRSDQGAVWEDVGAKAALFQAAAPTEAMSDVYRHVEGDIRDFRAAFRARPRQVGGVFAIDGRPVGLELFDASGTLESTLGRLVESYALDAIERPRSASPVPDAGTATAFLTRAAGARAEVAKAIGEGEDIRLEAEGLVGEALVVDGRVVHLSVLELLARDGQAVPVSERARRVTRRWAR